MSLKKNAVSGAKWTTLSKMVRSIFLLLQIVILTRYLDKADFGLVAMCMFVVNFTNIFVDAGFTSALLFKQDVKKKELSTLYWTNLTLAGLLFVVLLLLTPFVSDFYNETNLRKILPLLATNIIFIALGRLHLTVMQKNLQFKRLAIIDIVSVIIGLITAVTLAVLNYGIYSLIFSTLVVSLNSSILGVLLNWSESKIYFHFRLKELTGYFKVGGYNFGGLLIGFISTEIDTLLVGKLLGATNLGIYDLAKNIASKFYGIVSPILTKVLTPLLAKMQNNKADLKHYFIRVMHLVSYIAIPVYFMIVLNAKELLVLLYGPAYIDGYVVLSLMAVFYCINTVYNPVSSLQIATGKTKLGFLWALLCLFIFPIGIFVSAPFGIETVALSRTGIATLLIYMMWRIQIKQMIIISWWDFFAIFSKPLFLLVILTGVSLWFPVSLSSDNMYINLLVNSSVGIMVFGILIYIIDRKNLRILYSQIRAIISNKK